MHITREFHIQLFLLGFCVFLNLKIWPLIEYSTSFGSFEFRTVLLLKTRARFLKNPLICVLNGYPPTHYVLRSQVIGKDSFLNFIDI